MITIRCAGCKSKIFKYQKIGKGRVINCWKAKIIKDYSIRINGEVRCKCGKVIGKEIPEGVHMKSSAFFYTGTIVKK